MAPTLKCGAVAQGNARACSCLSGQFGLRRVLLVPGSTQRGLAVPNENAPWRIGGRDMAHRATATSEHQEVGRPSQGRGGGCRA